MSQQRNGEERPRTLSSEEMQEWAKKQQAIQRKKAQELDLPMEVMRIKQQLSGAKDQFNQIRSQLGELKSLRKAQEEQRQDIQDLQEKQEEILDSLQRIYETLNEFLAKDRPEASQAAKTVAEKIEQLEEQIGMIWEAVERIEGHVGLSD